MAGAELGRIAGVLRASDVSDAVLLDRFRHDTDEGAFAELVRRHGRAVLAACRQVLSDPADIDDSFQAAFVVLFRRVAAVDAATLGSWLYAVAHRVAVRARADAARRAAREGVAAARRSEGVEPPDPSWREAVAILHEELDRLPDTYRLVLLLCDLGGRSREEAAAELGCSPGSVKGRLERGRKLLAARLARRGIAPSVTLLAAVTGNSAVAAGPPPNLIELTVRAANGAASPSVAALARGVLPMRSVVKVGLACAVLSAGLAVAGLGVIMAGSPQPPGSKGPVTPVGTGPEKAAHAAPRADEKPTDKDKLQGRWQLVDADDSDGISKKRGFAKHVMVIKGDQMSTEPPLGGPDERGPFTIDPDKAPKRIDFRTGAKDSVNRLGIYSLDGDKLTICFSSVTPPQERFRPTEFTVKPGTGRVLLVYEREKTDAEKLLGEWKVVSAKMTQGLDPNADIAEYKDSVWKFDGKEFAVTRGKESYKLAYRLDPSKKPKEIDIGKDLNGKNDRRPYEGIYELDGDKLKVCYTVFNLRPADYSMARGIAVEKHLVLLERVKKDGK
jgi:RNA polymerase sigma factor (sigma-70 family)